MLASVARAARRARARVLGGAPPPPPTDVKLVLAVRTDLAMGKGKMCAQCAHAAILAFSAAGGAAAPLVRAWAAAGQPKVVVRAESEAALAALAAAAAARGVRTALVRDAGRTQVEPGSPTVLAIGPAAAADVDAVTGALRLL
jgi:PTH2 family peptidyl-tRNA hydrolase